ncbi:putative Zn-dependent peptidase [Thermolongibacillus altinsuensis]|jgi:predicted Zn-dependent peptidase|uniref:Putative Zn-dependent peptidase n=1 Tax=Thermolongibacillus altinsuensis TaxID=575256 RepID=A0A4R1QAX6_9BACL|nr:pitrilysin family protein [Thermolongibacillus altinsuensis]TCL45685.1 putative Zn-dependent peptidase [Thermolongibacillus altinsuensis]
MFQEQIEQIQGLRLHLIPTEKYKTNTIVFKMKAPLRKEDVTLRALLPYVLQSATKTHPTMMQLRSYLDDLYGATLHVDLMKKGEYHIITFRIDIANEKFLKDAAPLLSKALELLHEILFSPLLENGAFSTKIVEQEKRVLKQKIQSIFDDKMRYANLRLVQEMYKGEPYALDVHGELQDVDQIDAKRLYAYYERALKEDDVDLYVIGDVDIAEVKTMVERLFSFSPRKGNALNDGIRKTKAEVKEIIERQDVKQGKLNIGYRTNVTYNDDDYYALQVWNGIFGGFSHSKLFINVREKASLAYYAASRVESHQGFLMVMSGIEPKNYEKAVKIINEQMEAMKKGDFTDEEITQTKAVIRNQLLETIDTPRGMVEVSYHNVIAQRKRPFHEWLQGIDAVTRDQIVQVAKKIELDTIYFLTEKDGENQ